MRPNATVAAIVAQDQLRYFFLPPPAGRGFDLYRRYAVAALGPARARQLLQETGIDTAVRPDGAIH